MTRRWWPAYKTLRPASAPSTSYLLNNHILPTFGTIALTDLDADTIAAWKASLLTAGLKAHTINDYLKRLNSVLNAAVDAGYLERNPMRGARARAASPSSGTFRPSRCRRG